MTADPLGAPAAGTGPARGQRSPGRRRGRWPGSRAVAVLGLVASVAACGSEPSYQYVASADRSIVVRLPATWAQLDPAAIGVTVQPDVWEAYYDGSGKADPKNFLTKLPVSTPRTPVVRLVTVKTDPAQRVDDDTLRNILTPNTPHELIKFSRQSWMDDAPVTDVAVEEEPVDTATAKGLRIRSLYAFDIRGIVATDLTQTPEADDETVVVEKIAVTDRAGTHLHVIQVWCSVQCFVANEAQIDQVLSTFTVKAQA